jgi:excisionase family DNA binding protein
MSQSKINAPYQPIIEAAEATGLSTKYVRKGIRNGSIAHIKSGRKYFVDVPLLLEQLRNESQQNKGV